MAYQISYDYKEIKVEKIRKLSAIGYVFAVLGIVLLLLIAQLGGSALDVLLVKDRQIVQEAAGELVESIRSGEKIENAVNIFCQELAG